MGDPLYRGDKGSLSIANIDYEQREETVYNFSVANTNTYFVGVDKVLVHNCKKTYYSKSKKDKAHESAGGKCEYCGKKTQTEKPYQHDSNEGDHFIPQSKGGKTTPENHVSSCRTCNSGSEKGAKMPGSEWMPSNPNDRVQDMLNNL